MRILITAKLCALSLYFRYYSSPRLANALFRVAHKLYVRHQP